MLLFIISIVVLIVGIFVTWYLEQESDILWIVTLALVCVSGVTALIMGFGGIVTNSSVAKNDITIKLNERIESINNSRKSLEKKIESSTYTILEVNSYNDSVREYKTEVAQAQKRLDNIWINWLTCSAYNNFDVNAVSYLFVE